MLCAWLNDLLADGMCLMLYQVSGMCLMSVALLVALLGPDVVLAALFIFLAVAS